MTDVRKYSKMPDLVMLEKVESNPESDQHENLIISRGSRLANRYRVWLTSTAAIVGYFANRRRPSAKTHAVGGRNARSASIQRRTGKNRFFFVYAVTSSVVMRPTY